MYVRIGGSVLHSLESYLAGRQQFVSVMGAASRELKIQHGGPLGSVHGPLLFISQSISMI